MDPKLVEQKEEEEEEGGFSRLTLFLYFDLAPTVLPKPHKKRKKKKEIQLVRNKFLPEKGHHWLPDDGCATW